LGGEGLAGRLFQCRNYVERHFGKRDADRLFFYMQKSNPSTANIARINLFLHGVRSFRQAPPSDSLRSPYFREGKTRRLRKFDRIVMNSIDSDPSHMDMCGDPYLERRFQ
jgi:type I restriction enzyme M protein